ncbi:hypothetical protein GY21_05355 [Cryobacterium roopkundense]|uniref:Uncharacterized protein n=1 Tax=Cryobacterium roopkundense TaxID=1001240 RepID=A0A099JMG3_9MICO|nr:hypothetical protein GY21_05355 [Cryobacterium roopkundense]
MEREIDFARPRRMRCGSCRLEWSVNAEWLERFDRALVGCPCCGTDCQSEDHPNFWVAQEDAAHDDSLVRKQYWYHSTTHADWPNRDFDPTALLSDVTKKRMEQLGSGGGGLGRWAERQRAKALHIGTYEAAVENMFRRMRNQDGSAEQFYLYRVRLSPDCVIEFGVQEEPTDFVGDAHLADVCGVGVNTFRYVNTHEDPSSISLAVEIDALHVVQRIRIPLEVPLSDPWVVEGTERLLDAASRPAPFPKTAVERLRRMPSALAVEAQRIETDASTHLPLELRDRISAAFEEANFHTEPSAYPAKLRGLVQLVGNPQAVLHLLDCETWRLV